MKGKWRQNLHIEPPEGWMNDPNGLCFFDGLYHVYFQYSPGTPNGESVRRWGHYVSTDLLSWKYKGIVLDADIPEDRDGVFSGCALPSKDHIDFFYTGNVMEEGDHDYVLEGRGANVIHVSSSDGFSMSAKKVLLRNSDYPDFCSCHVRDPKVWIEDGVYKMVLGARTKDDKGCVLLYEGKSIDSFEYKEFLSAPGMGFMWECPDMFTLGDKTFLAFCPQGIPQGEYKYQNLFQSGYFTLEGGTLSDFEEFDYGFDFYAPQTFVAPDGRRLLIGWMGIGDGSYTNPTTELGWQHCLTLPRELSLGEDGKIVQKPLIELEGIKRSSKQVDGEAWEGLPFELDASEFTDNVAVSVSGAEITWDKSSGVLELHFTNGEGYGRTSRKILVKELKNLK
ncbi:MAG: glycoside hydrolase family 32 protein, partial [Clostridiales bacterium]|nr:glycoside hydrolase family 32 protein [Clostridiales bacterium]